MKIIDLGACVGLENGPATSYRMRPCSNPKWAAPERFDDAPTHHPPLLSDPLADSGVPLCVGAEYAGQIRCVLCGDYFHAAVCQAAALRAGAQRLQQGTREGEPPLPPLPQPSSPLPPFPSLPPPPLPSPPLPLNGCHPCSRSLPPPFLVKLAASLTVVLKALPSPFSSLRSFLPSFASPSLSSGGAASLEPREEHTGSHCSRLCLLLYISGPLVFGGVLCRRATTL